MKIAGHPKSASCSPRESSASCSTLTAQTFTKPQLLCPRQAAASLSGAAMQRAVETGLLLAWIILRPGVRSESLPEITDGKFIDECVRAHNRARSAVAPASSDMLYMTWDEGLAVTARAWARHCQFVHNIYLDKERVHPTFSSVGENIWTAYPPSQFNATQAVKRWVDEKEHYDFAGNGCRKVCGHYTQVVWAKSYAVGCAVQLCPNGVKHTSFADKEGVLFVCNYAPAGNVNGMRPYKTEGGPCSPCDGKCLDGLCWNQERNSEKSYSWNPDWDPAHPDKNYVPILVARPIAIVFTFVIAYGVHHFYPDVFCYE